jgi:glycosyltransferase involved in cell wall biosynthesis
VTQFIGDNTNLVSRNLVQNGIDGLASVWNLPAARALAAEIASRRPDVIHVHNTFAALSPSVFWAAAKTHTPVVLTLHNYRLTCANGLLFRDSAPCMECVGRPPIAALQHRCAYNGSFPVGASICLTRIVHSLFRTYHRKVDAFIALTGFQRDLMIRTGLPSARIHVKPNFAGDLPQRPEPLSERSKTIAFVGNTSAYKGLDFLLDVWSRIAHNGHQLAIVGDGPEGAELRSRLAGCADVAWHGKLSRNQALLHSARARWLALPSRCYEGFPMTLAEGLALGTPVIAPSHGCFPSIVRNNTTGILFSPDAAGLACALERAVAMEAPEWKRFSVASRTDHEERFTAEANYRQLIAVYAAALGRRDANKQTGEACESELSRRG